MVERSLKIYPSNQDTNFICINKKMGHFGIFSEQNNDYGILDTRFVVSKFPKKLRSEADIKNNAYNEDVYFEFLDDMLSLYDIVRLIKKNNKIDKEKSKYLKKSDDLCDSIIDPLYLNQCSKMLIEDENDRTKIKSDYIITNQFKKSYFEKEELDEYFVLKSQKELRKSINQKNFINDLLLASIDEEIFMLVYLWSEIWENKKYSLINASKIVEIVNEKYKSILVPEDDCEAKDISNDMNEYIRKIQNDYTGNLANNMNISGINSRHGKSYRNSTPLKENIDKKINDMKVDLLNLLNLYFIIVTNPNIFLSKNV